jgi:hypothetical protein
MIPMSTAECERSFSGMNLSMSPQRASLQIDHISALLFIKFVRPPLSKFNLYVKMWLLSGRRRAEETACRKKEDTEEENVKYRSLWSIL